MELKVVKSIDINDDSFLNSILELDEIAYNDDLQGNIASVKERYEKNKDSYLLMYDGANVVGYLCFFPISDNLLNKIYTSNKIQDDNICEKDILEYRKESNNIYVISMVIHPDYRDGEAIKILSNEFITYMKSKNENGYKINKILGTAVSDSGVKVMRNLNFRIIRYIENDYKVMECNIEDLNLSLKKQYKASFDSDIYIMMPLSNFNISNINEEENDDISKLYLDELYQNSKYECNNNISNSLKRYFIGKHRLVQYTDKYDGEIISLEDAYCFITSHKQTGLAILTISIPNSKASASQISDQVSVDKLDFMINGNIISVKEYIKKKYNLNQCGSAKSILCLSNMPEDVREFHCMLSGESYNSELIDYKVLSKDIDEIAKNNISQYDFYDAYVSSAGVVYIYDEFNKDYSYNINKEVPVLFIIELTMFQNMSITRTNNVIVEELQKNGDASFGFIEKLYREFGKTVVFWDKNNFKYQLSQNFADKVIDAFKISDNLNRYYRHQNFLEKIIELKDAQSSHKESIILNIVVITLTVIQIIPIIIEFINWLLNTNIILPFTTASTFSLSLIVLAVYMLKRKREKKKVNK